LVSAAGVDEFKVKRQEVFEFAQKPAVTREGDKVTIAFAAKGFCDATVAIEDAEGRIVRHLVSGVLGDNAPPPFQKSSKKQTLVWDGKNDKGEYVDDKDSHTVRVSLGLKPGYEKDLLASPHQRVGAQAPLMAANEEGVVVYDGLGTDFVKLFDHEGNYVRTIYPFPSSTLNQVNGLRWHVFPQDGKRLPLKDGYQLASLLTSGTSGFFLMRKPEIYYGGIAASAMAVRGRRIALAHLKLNRLATDSITQGLPLEGPRTALQVPIQGENRQIGPTSAAFSPDGKTLYLTGYVWHFGFAYHHGGVSGCLHGVWQIDFETDKEGRPFAGEMTEQGHGVDNAHFTVPTSVEVDAQGRVYVSDYVNDRIQIFSPDGKFLKSISTPKPAKVLVHQKTGEIFAFSWTATGPSYQIQRNRNFNPQQVKPSLHRYQSFEAPSLTRKSDLDQGFGVALDSWAPPLTLWTVVGKGLVTRELIEYWGAGNFGRAAADEWTDAGIKLRVEKDDRWVVKRDFGAEVTKKLKHARPPDFARQRLYWNPAAEKLYVAMDGGFGKSFSRAFRIDPETEKIDIVELPFDAEDLCFDLNGLAYLRTDGEVARFDSRTWREVPWDYGEERPGLSFSGGRRSEKLASVLPTPGNRPVCWHQGGMSVSAKGHLVVAACSQEKAPSRNGWKDSMLQQAGKPYTPAIYPGRIRWNEVHIWDQHGKLIHEDAFPGITDVGGIFLDVEDSLYVMAAPSRVLDGAGYFDRMSGTLIKARPGKVKVLGTGEAQVPLPKEMQPKRAPDVQNGRAGSAWVEGSEWFYGGVGYNGFNAPGAPSCDCWHSRFALDLLGRSFAPEMGHYSVAVLDSGGNLIVRVGQYGNVDDGKPLVKSELGSRKSESAEEIGVTPHSAIRVPRSIGGDEVGLFHPSYIATHTDRRLFIHDPGNQRIVSVKLGYHAEEKVALKDVKDTEKK
jgi:hypothetical protein